MNEKIYDELFLPANDMKQLAAEARIEQRLSTLRWLANHINYKAKEGKFSTTFITDCCLLADEDWEQLRNKGYLITFNYEDDTITISWEKDYGIQKSFNVCGDRKEDCQ